MKQILRIAAAAALLGCVTLAPVRAQEPFGTPGQWSLDIGVGPTGLAGTHAIGEQVLSPFAQVFAVIFTFGLYQPEKSCDEYSCSPGFSLRTGWQAKPWLLVTGELNGSTARADRIKEEGGPVERTDRWQSVSLLPGVLFTYFNRPSVQLYSGAAVGASFLFSDLDDGGLRPTFEIVPFGLKFGRKFYGTAELNWGTEFGATFRAGAGCRF